MKALQVGLALVCITVAATATVAVAAAGTEHVEGILELDRAVSLRGVSSAKADNGALHFRGPANQLSSVSLTADQILVTVAWYNGTELNPQDLTTYQQWTDSGRYQRAFTTVELQVDAAGDVPEVLAITNATSTLTALTPPGGGDLTAHSVRDAMVTRVEWEDAEDQVVAGPPDANPGFRFEVEGPWVVEDGLSSGAVTGNFTFFAHNVTLDVSSSDQGSWGIHAGRDEEPGPAPGAREFSVRVVTVEVYGGALSIETDSGLSLFAPRIASSLTGRVQGEGASGQLLAPETLYQYRDTSFELDGEGDLVLRPVAVASRLGAGATLPRLEMDVAGSFQVIPTSGLVTGSVPAPTSAAPDWWPWPAVLAVFVVVPLAAVAAYAGLRWRVRGPRFKPGGIAPEDLEALTGLMSKYVEPDTWKEEHTQAFGKDMSKALDAVMFERFEDAAAAAYRVVKAFPSSRDAWEVYARASLEAHRYDDAADAYARLNDLCQGAVPEVLRDFTRALWKARRRDEANEVLLEYAQADPEGAAGLVVRPGLIGLGTDVVDELYPDMLYAWTMRAWDDHRSQEAAYVFAALCRRSPHTTLHLVGDERYTPLWRSVFTELRLDALKSLIRHAIVHDRLALANDAFAELAFRNPDVARAFAREPPHEILLDDVRVAHLLKRTRRPDTDATPGE